MANLTENDLFLQTQIRRIEMPPFAGQSVRSGSVARPFWGRRILPACAFDILLSYWSACIIIALAALFTGESLWKIAPCEELAMLIYLFRDYFFNGRAVGKYLLGLEIIDVNTLEPPTVRQSIIRNLVLVSPFFIYKFLCFSVAGMPWLFNQTLFDCLKMAVFVCFVAVAVIELSLMNRGDGRRLADLLAGTVVVNRRTGI